MKIIKFVVIGMVAILILGVVYSGYLLSKNDIGGWRLNFSLDKVEINDYSDFNSSIRFAYPVLFEIDLDEGKKYGPDYIAGIKLKTDERTGCDVRTGGPDLDFSKSKNELSEEITGPIKERAQDFNLIAEEKIKIGGEDAYKVSFSFLDPIGARIRLDQIFTKNDDKKYFMICGAGEYQYDFFEKDFRIFYDSINFNLNESDFEQKNFLDKIKF